MRFVGLDFCDVSAQIASTCLMYSARVMPLSFLADSDVVAAAGDRHDGGDENRRQQLARAREGHVPTLPGAVPGNPSRDKLLAMPDPA